MKILTEYNRGKFKDLILTEAVIAKITGGVERLKPLQQTSKHLCIGGYSVGCTVRLTVLNLNEEWEKCELKETDKNE